MSVPNLNWPKYWSLPAHLNYMNRFYTIVQQLSPPGICWGCSGKHHTKDCNPDILAQIPICNGSDRPTCKIRHKGFQCPFVGKDRWMDGNDSMYNSPGSSTTDACRDNKYSNRRNDDRDGSS